MSFEAMTWAVKQKIPSLEKLVLLMLANRTNPDTGRCDPSYNRLAEDCGMDERTVIRKIQSLEKKGALRIVKRTNKTNQFFLATGWQGDTPPVTESHPQGVSVSPPEVSQSHPKQRKETEKRNRGSSDEDIMSVLQHLNTKAGKQFRPLEANLKFIRARLAEGATVDEMKAVVDAKVLEWKGDRVWERYLRPETLFNATKYQTYSAELTSSTNSQFAGAI